MGHQIEVTDTFGGEANYCWVNRKIVETPKALPLHSTQDDQRRIHRFLVRQAKAFAGWTGIRCDVSNYGDMIEIRPRGVCQVAFVTWVDETDQAIEDCE